jgi:hypothetical protein
MSSAATALCRLTREIDRLTFRLRLVVGLIALAFLAVFPLEVLARV